MKTKWFVFLSLFASLISAAQAQQPDVLRDARAALAEGNARSVVHLLEAVPPHAMTKQGQYLLGLAYQDLYQHEKAVGALSAADTADAHVLVATAVSLDQLGRTEEAIARYRAALSRDASNPNFAVGLARLMARQDQWDEVIPLYERLLRRDDDNSYLHAQLAVAYTSLDSLGPAIVHYERSFRLNPRNVDVALALSELLNARDRLDESRLIVEQALEVNPNSGPLWQRRGEIALREDEYAKATEYLEKAISLGERSGVLYHSLGMSYYSLKRYRDAQTAFEQSYALDPSYTMNVFYLGLAQHQVGQYDEAIATLQQAGRLLGQLSLAEVFVRIASVYDAKKERAEALNNYQLALNLSPDNTVIHFYLAALYDSENGEPSKALREYERFLAGSTPDAFPQYQGVARRRVAELRNSRYRAERDQ